MILQLLVLQAVLTRQLWFMVESEGWRRRSSPWPGAPSTAHAFVRITEMYLEQVPVQMQQT